MFSLLFHRDHCCVSGFGLVISIKGTKHLTFSCVYALTAKRNTSKLLKMLALAVRLGSECEILHAELHSINYAYTTNTCSLHYNYNNNTKKKILTCPGSNFIFDASFIQEF